MTTLYIALLLLVWNIVVFCVYGYDKQQARKNKYRISEKTLLLLSFLLGSVGAMCGIYGLRHKTKHLKFKILVPLSLLLHCVLLVYYLNTMYHFLPL